MNGAENGKGNSKRNGKVKEKRKGTGDGITVLQTCHNTAMRRIMVYWNFKRTQYASVIGIQIIQIAQMIEGIQKIQVTPTMQYIYQ